jgi:hypothetical protein
VRRSASGLVSTPKPHNFAAKHKTGNGWAEGQSGDECRLCEVDAFYWTDMAPDIVNPGREEQGSFSV